MAPRIAESVQSWSDLHPPRQKMEIPPITKENALFVLGLMVPGMIILYVRSQFITGRKPTFADGAVSYVAVSAIYYSLVLPFFLLAPVRSSPLWTLVVLWLWIVILLPAVFGLALGVDARQGFFRQVLRRCGLNPVHAVPSAWDWKFGDCNEHWALVTLKDGTEYAGFCGGGSFMSSDPTERDVFIERIYDVDDDKNWIPRGDNGVLIVATEIRTIEVWPYRRDNQPESKT